MQQTQAVEYTQKRQLHFNNSLLGLSAVGTVLLVVWLIKYSSYGFDFTDESFYIVSIANPFLYDWSLSQFGFIYHPLYLLLDGDIADIRRANIVITYGLSWVMLYLLLKSILPGASGQRLERLVVSAGFATASLIVFSSWLLTPSYNSLAFQSLLIAATGLLLAEKSPLGKSVYGWVLLGIGGWLAFMAKPSTALALAVVACLYLVFSRKFSIRMVTVAIIAALIPWLISALLIDNSIHEFVDRLQTGVLFASYLGGGHTLEQLIRFDGFRLNGAEKTATLIVAILSFSGAWLACSHRRVFRAGSILVSTISLVVVAALVFGLVDKTPDFGYFKGLIIWAIVFSALLLSVVILGRKYFLSFTLAQLAVALLFLAMPHVYAFGTANNYWRAGGYVAIFWLLSGIVVLGPLARIRKNWNFALPLTLATHTVTAVLLQTGINQPYRQPQPVRLNDTVVAVGPAGTELVLSEQFADYLEIVMMAAHTHGLGGGTPVIDLTGQSPGVLYAMGAENIGQAWVIGGYPGSSKLTAAALRRVSCDRLSIAWLLIEENGPRSITAEVLTTYGANQLEHFEHVASWMTAKGVGGFAEPRQQDLYKPRRPEAVLAACRKLIGGRAS